jgi:hypothetical protein
LYKYNAEVILKVTTERDVPVFSDDDTGIITNEDDIIVYQGNNSAFNLNEGRQKIIQSYLLQISKIELNLHCFLCKYNAEAPNIRQSFLNH